MLACQEVKMRRKIMRLADPRDRIGSLRATMTFRQKIDRTDSIFVIISVNRPVDIHLRKPGTDSSLEIRRSRFSAARLFFLRMRSRIGSLRDDMIGAVHLSIEVCSTDSFHFHGSR